MQKEEPLLYGYNYRFLKDANNAYAFDTANGIAYEVRFKPTSYFFDEEFILGNETFEMAVEIVNESASAPFDKATGLTISAIINDFYQRSPLTTTIFICDDSDKREVARQRRFSSWFSTYNEGKFSKYDFEWQDSDSRIFYLSVIVLSQNPYAEQIKERFHLLATAFQQDK